MNPAAQDKFLVALFIVATIIVLYATFTHRLEIESTKTYIVQSGDTVWEIATDSSPDVLTDKVVSDIKEINGLHNYTIHPGQVLELPVYKKS
jgi:LysM repeat protein